MNYIYIYTNKLLIYSFYEYLHKKLLIEKNQIIIQIKAVILF